LLDWVAGAALCTTAGDVIAGGGAGWAVAEGAVSEAGALKPTPWAPAFEVPRPHKAIAAKTATTNGAPHAARNPNSGFPLKVYAFLR